MRLLFLALLLCGQLLLAQQTPDPLALVRRAVALEQANAERERDFAYRERVVSIDLDSSGRPKERIEKVHDVLMIEGSPQRLLLEEGGKPVSAEELRGQQDFLRRVVQVRKQEPAAKRRERIQRFEEKRNEFRQAIAEVLEAFNFRLLGEEDYQGRTSYVLAATPRTGYRPKNRYGKIFTQTHGKIWIDKATGQWRRAEGKLHETVNLGWIFVQMQKETSAVVEQRPFGDAGWLMSHLWYRTALRVGLFVHYRMEQDARYWNYRPMTPQWLTEVLAADYRPPLQPPSH